jgi:hypothetical protein
MSDSNPKESTVSQLDDLFGPPPLIRGEDLARYWRLHAAVAHQMKPKDLFDDVRVREFTDKLWQQQRCKRSAASLVEGAYVEALASLFRQFKSPTIISMGEDTASTMARDYYSGEAKANRMREIESLLVQYGITPEQILAKAMQLCGGGVLMLNRMVSDCETSLRMLQKDNDRRASEPSIETIK